MIPEPIVLQDRAYHSIRRKIIDGRVRSHKDLSRRVLQAELGLSSTSIQIALARLEGERLLESRPQSGTFLRDVDFKEYCDQYELRERIEPYGASLAAEKITKDQLKTLRESCEEYADIEEFWKAGPIAADPKILERTHAVENVFHGTIMQASDNATAAHIVENLRVVRYNGAMTAALPPVIVRDLVRLTVREHCDIFAALQKHDAKLAERRMLRHLRRGRRYVARLQSEPSGV